MTMTVTVTPDGTGLDEAEIPSITGGWLPPGGCGGLRAMDTTATLVALMSLLALPVWSWLPSAP
ncbi:MAG TPA: hypothetical protein VIM19_13890 [Actinomycetes bacterium]